MAAKDSLRKVNTIIHIKTDGWMDGWMMDGCRACTYDKRVCVRGRKTDNEDPAELK
jgi:hypothetical protein